MLRIILALSICLVLFALSCSGASDQPLSSPTAPAGTASPNGVSATPANGDGTGALPQVQLLRVFDNVTLSRTTGMTQAPDGSWWALDQSGKVVRFENRGDARAEQVIDISARLTSGGEQGLLGLAFAPDFARSRVFYLNYTASGPLRTVIGRFKANDAGTSADPGSETVVLEIADFASNHNGGQMAFGTDGYLYFSIGDGGGGNDPQDNGQNLGAMLGKIHRIDVSKPSGGLQYTIPPDNPFVGQSGARGEIWAYGLRNPWRFSFDTATGQMWAGDVGQNAREEVDLITKGGNYGWKIMEGSQCRGGGTNCDRAGLTLPVIDYATANGRCSVTGGYVYRGSAIPALRGAYVYGDYCSGEIWALRYDGSKVTEQGLIADLGTQLSSFAQDTNGEIYALGYGSNGQIFKLAP
ncbi:MAG: sorbosone dehydrogenase family protein [Dehalococcoidia bacterium]